MGPVAQLNTTTRLERKTNGKRCIEIYKFRLYTLNTTTNPPGASRGGKEAREMRKHAYGSKQAGMDVCN